ncbi:MAG: hypothetical protein QNK23_01250 [Crocinitomicaceae bacterium]|nr:hypothetical protein [Crocinitomicaceae bacterium]
MKLSVLRVGVLLFTILGLAACSSTSPENINAEVNTADTLKVGQSLQDSLSEIQVPEIIKSQSFSQPADTTAKRRDN